MTNEPIAEGQPDKATINRKAKFNLLAISQVAMVMFFAGLTSAYLVSKGDGYWVSILKMPDPFFWSTYIIVASSITMIVAQRAVKRDQKGLMTAALVATLGLGVAFSFSQYEGYKVLFNAGNAVVGHIEHIDGTYGEDYVVMEGDVELVYSNGDFYLPDDQLLSRPVTDKVMGQGNRASSYFYIITFMHFVHLLFGLIALIVMSIKGISGRYDSTKTLGLRLGARYWHFLGALWLYLFLFLLFIH